MAHIIKASSINKMVFKNLIKDFNHIVKESRFPAVILFFIFHSQLFYPKKFKPNKGFLQTNRKP